MRAIDWARAVADDPETSPTDRLIAYALAFHSRGGETSVSLASWRTVGDWTGMGRTATAEGLRRLRAREWLAVIERRDSMGRRAASLYVFTMPIAPVDNPPEEAPGEDPRAARRHPKGRQTDHAPSHQGPPDGPLKGIRGLSKVTAPRARPVDEVIKSIARARKLR